MTVAEFSNEFDILYDNISSSSAPGLDLYEKSVYLTTAQFELVKAAYCGYNPLKRSFEGDEQKRRELSELVKDFKSAAFLTSAKSLSTKSKLVNIPADVMYIVYESADLLDNCGTRITVEVNPISYDDLNASMKNPFRKPNGKRVFRLDISKDAASKNVELVSEVSLLGYSMRYVKYPLPIVLADFELDANLVGLGLKVNNANTIKQCELDESIHREILNRAVELAIRDYRENSLQSKIQTNQRVV
jgi:hypothetical protein